MKLQCSICPHHCILEAGQRGFCKARKNNGNSIVADSYGRIAALALDPVEKKPFRRFNPGTYILSVGSYGCNMRCAFCQNNQLSQPSGRIKTAVMLPDELVAEALRCTQEAPGNIGLAFTYNEPCINYEYVYDTAHLAHDAGLAVVLVTNGHICREPLQRLLPYVDAMNIDLKGFDVSYYAWLGGNLDTVLQSIEMAAATCHVEVTTLIVPGYNDDELMMEREAVWLATIAPELPLHITRFFPRYLLQNSRPTSVDVVHRLCAIAKKHLQFVYAGNC